jgi:hypothetical protein
MESGLFGVRVVAAGLHSSRAASLRGGGGLTANKKGEGMQESEMKRGGVKGYSLALTAWVQRLCISMYGNDSGGNMYCFSFFLVHNLLFDYNSVP